MCMSGNHSTKKCIHYFAVQRKSITFIDANSDYSWLDLVGTIFIPFISEKLNDARTNNIDVLIFIFCKES